MTGIIYYCDTCGVRIPHVDAEDKPGADSGQKFHCPACAPTEAPRIVPVRPSVRRSGTRIPAVENKETGPLRRPKPALKSASRSNDVPLKAAAAFVLISVLVYVALTVFAKKPTQDLAAPKIGRSTPLAPASATPVAPEIAPPAQRPPIASAPAPVQVLTSAPLQTTANPTAPPAVSDEDKNYDPRSAFAFRLLAQAKAYIAANPDEVFSYQDQLERIRDNHKGTGAAGEAADLLASLKLPAVDPETNPPPTPESAWANAVQLVPAIDPGQDSIKGHWTKNNGALRSDRETWSRLALPYTLPEEYDVRITFTRTEADDCLLLILSRHGRPFVFSLGGASNTGCSLEQINPKRKYMLPVKLSRPGVLASNQRTQVVVQVRRQLLRAFLNGKPTVGCLADDDEIQPIPEFQPAKPNQASLATWASVYEIHAIEILELKGHGEFLRAPPK